MERLVDSYIRAGPIKSFPFMESQYAYHRGRSTDLHGLVQKIEGSWNQKKFALGVFLDIDGAFGNASFGSMDAGGVLFPLLWNMVVDCLLRRLHNAHYQAQGYADDVVLQQKGKFVIACRLNCIVNWCRAIGLSVNADNTKMVMFTNNRKIGGFYNPRLFGTELRMTDQVKNLGVRILKIGCAKPTLHIGSVVVLWERLGDYHRRW
jgi:hypothetical protein